MKNTGKDKFEQFFQDNLKDYNSSPSDDLWGELEHRIPPPPRSSIYRKIGGWVFLLVGLVFLFSTIQWWQQGNEIENINQTLQQQDQKITSISNELKNIDLEKKNKISEKKEKKTDDSNLLNNDTGLIKTNDIRSFNNEIEFIKPNIGDKKKLEENIFNKKSINDFNGENKNSEPVEIESIETVNSLLNTAINATEKIESAALEIKEKPEVVLSTIAEPESISSLVMFLESQEPKLNYYGEEYYETLDFGYPRVKHYVEFYSNYGWVLPKMKNKDFTVESIGLPSRYTDFGASYGLKISDRLLVQFGIGYGKEYTGVQFQKEFKYAEEETFINNNLARTKYSYYFNSNYRHHKFDFYILNEKQNDGQDVVADDPFTMDIQVMKKHRFITAPVVLKYLWGKRNSRLSGSLKIGFFQKYSFLENELSTVNVEGISEERLFHSSTSITRIGIQRTRNLSYILGAGAEYKLSSKFVLVVEPTYQKTLYGLDKVLPYNLGIYTGLRWNFQ